MKSDPIDYVLSTIAVLCLLTGSVGVVWLLSPASFRFFASYHIVANILVLLVSYGMLSAALIRLMLLLKPMPCGSFAMDSPSFIYWKFLKIVTLLGQGALAPVIGLFSRVAVQRLFGACIERDVLLGGTIDDPFHISIGRGSVLGLDSLVSANYISGSKLVCGVVHIGKGVTIGAKSTVFSGSSIGDNATLLPGSQLMPGTVVPSGETWRGTPARKVTQPS